MRTARQSLLALGTMATCEGKRQRTNLSVPFSLPRALTSPLPKSIRTRALAVDEVQFLTCFTLSAEIIESPERVVGTSVAQLCLKSAIYKRPEVTEIEKSFGLLNRLLLTTISLCVHFDSILSSQKLIAQAGSHQVNQCFGQSKCVHYWAIVSPSSSIE